MAGGAIMDGLTIPQDTFARCLAEGMTQRAAFQKAFNTSNMKITTVDSKASTLAKQEKIRERVVKYRDPVIAIFEKNAEKYAESITDAALNAGKNGDKDYNARYKASKIALDYAGYAPVEKSANVNINADMNKEDVEDLLKGL